uniref:Chemosensory protein 4 n=1 Tax=Encarsia formosa TaxID=32400 RepID=A0A6M5CFC9_ENCFO|nr:chemosensory protein 4 [Encarsia formosa]
MKSYAIVLIMVVMITKTESQNVQMLLQNRQLVEREISCVLNRGPCDIIGNVIKSTLPEALNNNCRNCTPQQAQASQQIIAFMRAYYPRESQEILQLYGRRGK